MLRADVATPALFVDIDALDRNIARMARLAESLGVRLRPHTKSHKSIEIAHRLVAAGATGVCCATLEEAEAMALGGIGGILLTSPLAAKWQFERLHRLLARGADISTVVDSLPQIAGLSEVANATGRPIGVVVEVDVGVGRTGCVEVKDIVRLAAEVKSSNCLRYDGIQAYWGHLQQVMPHTERARLAGVQIDRVKGIISDLEAADLAPGIVTGVGTGTFSIDAASGLFTEVQTGSFMFLDSCYGSIDLGVPEPFETSLFVAATVVSSTRPGRVIVNAGFKAFATDSGLPVAQRGSPAGATYRYMGDEHGAVDFEGNSPSLGSTIEFITSHCDPTVNLYPAYHVVRGEEIVDRWPILARYGNFS